MHLCCCGNKRNKLSSNSPKEYSYDWSHIIACTHLSLLTDESACSQVELTSLESEASRRGYLVDPACAHTCTKTYICSLPVNKYSSFSRTWARVSSSPDYLLYMHDYAHFAAAWDTDFESSVYCPGGVPLDIAWQDYTIIKGVTRHELYDKCVAKLVAGEVEDEHLYSVCNFIAECMNTYGWPFIMDQLAGNTTVLVLMHELTGAWPLYGTVAIEMLIGLTYDGVVPFVQSRRVLDRVKANAHKVNWDGVGPEHRATLAHVFFRYKKFLCALKTPASASHINRARKLADVLYRPVQRGYWGTILSQSQDYVASTIDEQLNELTDPCVLTNLIHVIDTRLTRNTYKLGNIYSIKNSTVFIDKYNFPGWDSMWFDIREKLKARLLALLSPGSSSLIIKLPRGIALACPTGTTPHCWVGEYPIGTCAHLKNNIATVYADIIDNTEPVDINLDKWRYGKTGFLCKSITYSPKPGKNTMMINTSELGDSGMLFLSSCAPHNITQYNVSFIKSNYSVTPNSKRESEVLGYTHNGKLYFCNASKVIRLCEIDEDIFNSVIISYICAPDLTSTLRAAGYTIWSPDLGKNPDIDLTKNTKETLLNLFGH